MAYSIASMESSVHCALLGPTARLARISRQDLKTPMMSVWKVPGTRDALGRFTPNIKERLTCAPFCGGSNPFTLFLLQDTRGGW